MVDISSDSDDIDSITETGVKILNEPTVEEVDRTFMRKTIEFIQTKFFKVIL